MRDLDGKILVRPRSRLNYVAGVARSPCQVSGGTTIRRPDTAS
jgi:hypothetical protein